MSKQRILIVDDSDINRMIISNMLGDKYDLIEASNGNEALSTIQSRHGDVDLILLDMIMPGLDGLGVLDVMNRRGWIKSIPVIMISAETSPAFTKKAFELGAEDYISRPFDPNIISRRIQNIMMLHAKQDVLMDKITEQFYEREKQNSIMISMLSHIVETRNGESGAHVVHINTICGILLDALTKRTNKYGLTEEDKLLIRTASSFHDIGKLTVPSEVLNKPGKLTDEEFEEIKKHSAAGAAMISAIPGYEDEPIMKYSYEICRWHHERWDGKGYPDGLVGDDIPISAQVVSMADVYDALTSVRCYKPAYSHEKAIEMINNGECGMFNPMLLQSLNDSENVLNEQVGLAQNTLPFEAMSNGIVNRFLNDLHSSSGTDVSRNIRLLRMQEEINNAFADYSSEMWFELLPDPATIKLNSAASKWLKLPKEIDDPLHNKEFTSLFDASVTNNISALLNREDTESKAFDISARLSDGRKCQIIGKIIWATDENDKNTGITCAVGRIIPEN